MHTIELPFSQRKKQKKNLQVFISPSLSFKENIEMKPFFLDILPTLLPAAVATDV